MSKPIKNRGPHIHPKVITLSELLPQGQNFEFSDVTGEITAELKDLLADRPYSVKIDLKPVGNAFDISGEIKCELELICSRCAREMPHPLDLKFQEIIVIIKEKPRAGHSGHTGQEDGGIFCNYQTSHVFDLADFTHEQIASNEPFAPLCGRADCDKEFEEAQEKLNQNQKLTPSPFDILKKMTVRRQRD
jgi:uncharacterized metal-binding protein YceD (DUF177 family)